MDNEFSKDTIDRLIDYYKDDRESLIPWLQRREVSAWSAVLFYIAILWSITNIIIKPEKNYVNEFGNYEVLVLLVLLFFLFIVFFRFVHAQYSSIY
jgi:hypothetical protein